MGGMKKLCGKFGKFRDFCAKFWLSQIYVIAKATLVWILIACGALGIFIYMMFSPNFFIMLMLLCVILGLILW